jgi:hypothetical protein
MNFYSRFDQISKEYFKGYNEQVVQWIVAFSLGVLLASWSTGFVFYIMLLIGKEIFFYIRDPSSLLTRVGIIFLSLYGYIIGRSILQYDDPLEDNKRTSKNEL